MIGCLGCIRWSCVNVAERLRFAVRFLVTSGTAYKIPVFLVEHRNQFPKVVNKLPDKRTAVGDPNRNWLLVGYTETVVREFLSIPEQPVSDPLSVPREIDAQQHFSPVDRCQRTAVVSSGHQNDPATDGVS